MSEDSFTEVTTESWLGRIGGALKGIVFGLVLFIIAHFPHIKNGFFTTFSLVTH